MGFVNGTPNIWTKRQNFRPKSRCFIGTTPNIQMFTEGGGGKEQHFINNTLPLTKKVNRCMNNPKEQIKWELLMLLIFYSCHLLCCKVFFQATFIQSNGSISQHFPASREAIVGVSVAF